MAPEKRSSGAPVGDAAGAGLPCSVEAAGIVIIAPEGAVRHHIGARSSILLRWCLWLAAAVAARTGA